MKPFGRISVAQIIGVILILALLVSALLSLGALLQARQHDYARLESVTESLVDDLQAGGLAAARTSIDTLSRSFPGYYKDITAGIWRRLDGLEVLNKSFGDNDWDASSRGYRSIEIDAARRSVEEDWDQKYDEIIRVAMVMPGQSERAARRMLLWFWAGYVAVSAAAFALYWHSERRLRDSTSAASSRLEAFAAGDTGIRLDKDYPSPEISRLGAHINPILARLEDLILDLRRTAESAIHEINRPIQKAKRLCSKLDEFGQIDRAQVDGLLMEALSNVHAVAELMSLDAERGMVQKRSMVDFGDLVAKRIEVNEEALKRQDRSLEIDIGATVAVDGEERLLTILVDNLLDNAAKYAPESTAIRVGLVDEGETFRFSVANAGGFPEDLIDPFARYKRSEKFWAIPGLGIGLSFVKRIAERHGFSAEVTPSQEVAEIVIAGRTARVD